MRLVRRMPFLLVVMVPTLFLSTNICGNGVVPADYYRQRRRKLRLATWNIAAVNNNPFEYWITHEECDVH